jgi:hypothetical protein
MPIYVNVVQECPSLPQDKLAMDDDSSNGDGQKNHPGQQSRTIPITLSADKKNY